MKQRQAIERFREKFVVASDGCWNWTASTDRYGYGKFKVDGKVVIASRWHYQQVRGAVPAGLDIDHLCRNRACVNPDHLEPVTHRENLLRSDCVGAINARKTHCLQGHPYSPENTRSDGRGGRVCRTCEKVWRRAS